MHHARAAYDEIYIYTMGRPGFILQHVVDAAAVQNATEGTAGMGLIFGLAGLFLRVEKQLSGRQVQEAHKKLAARKRQWPAITLPQDRGRITCLDVLAAPAGSDRD